MPNASEEIRAAMRDLMQELKESRKAVDAQLETMSNRLLQVPERLEVLRREMLGLFITRTEYDPKHQIVLDKLTRYDRIIDDSAKSQQEFTQLKSDVAQQRRDLDAMSKAKDANPGRIIQYVAIAIAVLGFLLNLFQHIKFS